MGKSYRRPYTAICGGDSAKQDKIQAHRGVRRAQNGALRNFKFEDWDEFLMPVMRECSWNNVYSWGRDGSQHYQMASKNLTNPFYFIPIYRKPWTQEELEQRVLERIRDHENWMARIQRK